MVMNCNNKEFKEFKIKELSIKINQNNNKK